MEAIDNGHCGPFLLGHVVSPLGFELHAPPEHVKTVLQVKRPSLPYSQSRPSLPQLEPRFGAEEGQSLPMGPGPPSPPPASPLSAMPPQPTRNAATMTELVSLMAAHRATAMPAHLPSIGANPWRNVCRAPTTAP